jgi:methionine-S-sulfoxide reductase
MVGVIEMETIYLAGGCFWGMQKYLDQFDGVIETEVGYANGPDLAPSYEDVCNNSGHAETVRVGFDAEKTSLEELLGLYFEVIDPVSVNRQGGDRGVQYRTGIFYTDEAQLPVIREVYGRVQEAKGTELAVLVEPIRSFYSAEEYHQKYLDKNPTGYCHIPASFFDRGKKDQGKNK